MDVESIEDDRLAVFRHDHVPAKPFANVGSHRLGGFGFAVSGKDSSGCVSFALEPSEDTFPVSMGGKAFDLLDVAADGHPVFHDLYLLLAILDSTACGSGRLISDKDYRGVFVGQHTERMVKYSPTGKHSRGGDYYP